MNSTIKVIQPSGILDSINGNQLRREVGDLISIGVKTVLIDCQNVEMMDSSGLSTLVMALKSLREAGGKLSFCSMNAQLRMVLELTGMDEVFEVFPSQNEFNQVALATN